MAPISSASGLAIGEIIFYVPALLSSLAVCFKQGWARNIGWFYLCLISVLRLIGASVTLYIQTQNDYDSGLLETVAITSAIGLSPLLLCLMGILQRLHANMVPTGYPDDVFRPIHLLGIVALILGIVGGVDSANVNSNNYDTGRDCAKAATILFLAVYVALAIISILTATQKRSQVASAEKKLLVATVIVLPFVFVRLVYSIASAFSTPGSVFYFLGPNIWVQAFMMFMMEAIAVIFYIWAGLFTLKSTPTPSYQQDMEAYGTKERAAREPRRQHLDLRQERPARQHQQRSIGDYRPSRLIRNAIRDRQ